ncbi:uncharacterized protein LOC130449711 [Diorhabda sublineata]|uniref:uncharacterized protein LOC130449711 n=1 Tax=Diorhabda sublineata TaxID=1163346 RepID=UPI0024E054EF|nr:uncharacterized protein LOC130449711 [Diorhabda sublineata]
MVLPKTFVEGFHDEEEVKRMKYTKFGNTDMYVSKLSIGTGGFSYFYGDYNVEECKKTIYKAIKSGINYIDTGPWYGHGTAEEILGKCLEGIPRKAYYVATKIGRYEQDPKLMFNFSSQKTKESIDVTLKRLKLDYVDVLQVHDIEFAPNMDIILNETLPTLQELKEAGKTKYIGITGYPVSTLVECIEKSKVEINMILSYTRLTMIDNTLKSFIPILKSKNIGIVNAAANGMGLLTNSGPQDWHPAYKEIKDVASQAQQICKENDVELGKLAVHHSLQEEDTETILIGMNTTKLVDMNLDVFYNGLTEKEQTVYKQVISLFDKLTVRHWENVELKNYRKIIKGEDSSGFFTTK